MSLKSSRTAENSFSEEEVKVMIRDLKEKGIINFLRAYLATGQDGEMASLRKLLLGLGIIPVSYLNQEDVTS
jgi:NAD-dependent histone deacetylase SIR2